MTDTTTPARIDFPALYGDSLLAEMLARDTAAGPDLRRLNAEQADRRILLQKLTDAYRELDQALAATPEGLYENWAVGHTDPFGDRRHVQCGAEESARSRLATSPHGAVLERRWQTDWATVYPQTGDGRAGQ